ncbi:MAG TPA: hypothetical protein VF552_14910 [Allosphingosinicella sp.]|jgi:hypothetical protein
MLEYGEVYLRENERILEAMYAHMAPEAAALARHMALEDADWDEDEDELQPAD